MFSFSFTLTFGTLLHAHCTHHRCAKKRKLVKVPAVPSNFDTGKSLFPSPLTCGAQLNRITEFTRNFCSYGEGGGEGDFLFKVARGTILLVPEIARSAFVLLKKTILM